MANRAAALAIGLTALGTMHAAAVFDPTFDAGDLIFGVQSSASTSFVLEVNLGAPGQFKNANSTFLVGNINSQLESIFGMSWFNDPSLFFGVAGARSNLAVAGTADSSGDFNSTAYASRSRDGNGTVGSAFSSTWTVTPASVSTAASGMIQQGNTFNGVAPAGVAVKSVDTVNPNDWSDLNSVSGSAQGTAYSTFVGGIQYRFDTGTFGDGSFGGLTNVEGAIDLYRIARFSNGGATPGVGSYEGSFAIERDGDVFFVVPEPGTVTLLGLGFASFLGFSRQRKIRA